MHLTLVNLLGVATIAFFVPFVLGFFPRARVPAVALELVAGIIVGPINGSTTSSASPVSASDAKRSPT